MNSESLAKNSIYNVLYKLLNVLFPLVSVTYVSRTILASGVGQVSYAQNIVAYFTLIAALGIPNYGTREIAKVRSSRFQTSKTFSELFTINAISTFFCTIAYYLLVFSVQTFRDNLSLFLVAGLAIVFNVINVDWFYQGREQFAYIAFRSFLIKILSLASLFFFVRSKNDVTAYAMIYCLGVGGNNLFNIFNLRRFGVRPVMHGLTMRKHLRPIFIMLSSVVFVELYTMVDTTMLGTFSSSQAVGYFANASKLVKVIISVITAVGGVLLPRLSYYYGKGMIKECSDIVSKVFAIMLYLFVPCEVGIITVADLLMPILFGNSFDPGITTLRITSLLICTLGFSNLFGTQVLLTFNREKQLLIATIFGAVSNIALNIFLIPLYAQNGAAVASVVSETLVTLVSYFYAQKLINIQVSSRFLWSVLISTLAMVGAIVGVRLLQLDTIMSLTLSTITGVVVYFGTSQVTRNPVFLNGISMIRKRTN